MSEPEHQGGDDHDGAVVGGPLLEAGGDRPPLLESPEAAFDHVAAPVRIPVECQLAARPVVATGALVGPLWDGVGDAAPPQHSPGGRMTVAFVGQEPIGPLARPAAPARPGDADSVEHRHELWVVAPLP